MSKLKSLKQRLEQLPETKKLKGLIDTMQQYQKKLTETLTSFDNASHEEQRVNAVFGANSVALVESSRKQATRVAKKLRDDIETLSDSRTKIENSVIKLTDIATGLSGDIKTQWQGLIDQKLKSYEKLVGVAQKLKLEGADELAKAITDLKDARQNIPKTQSQINAIAEQVKNLPLEINKLELENEEVQQFLEAAATGIAKLKIFVDNPSIQEFIQKHKLWDLFRIRII